MKAIRLRSPLWIIVAFVLQLEASPGAGMMTPNWNPLDNVDKQAAELSKNVTAPNAQALTDAVFVALHIQSKSDNPLRNRLSQAEYQFWRAAEGGVSEQHAVDAINNSAKLFRRPQWALTNTEQVHIVRSKLKSLAPHFIGNASGRGSKWTGVGTTMSPLEASFVALYLSLGKMFDESYQVPAETWVTRTKTTDSMNAFDETGNLVDSKTKPVPRPELRTVSRPSKFAADAEQIMVSLGDLDLVAVTAAQRFLDDLGIKR